MCVLVVQVPGFCLRLTVLFEFLRFKLYSCAKLNHSCFVSLLCVREVVLGPHGGARYSDRNKKYIFNFLISVEPLDHE